MARKLKTFVTSIGFYDLAVAAPSMKAALEAWDSKRNLFHDGTAQETEEPSVVRATFTQPGVVLRRPVGSSGEYKEKPDALKDLPANAPRQAKQPKGKPKLSPKKSVQVDERAGRAAILSFEKAKAKRDAAKKAEQERAAAQRSKEEVRIRRAVRKADDVLEQAKTRHEKILADLEGEREKLERRISAERNRWDDERRKLEAARQAATK